MTETFDMSDAPPSPGAQLTFYGQPYIISAVEPYTRRDGKLSAIIYWVTMCATCKSELVRFKTGLAGKIDTRRCKTCITRRRATAIKSKKSRPSAWKGKKAR